MRWYLILLVIFFSLLTTSGRVPGAEVKIREIVVEGNKRIEREVILRKLKFSVDQELNPEVISESIKSLFKTGYFENIKVDLKEMDDGVNVTFIVDEKPIIKDHRIEGEDKVTDEKIEEVLTIRDKTFIDPDVIRSDLESIKRLYSEEGYYLAGVEDVIEPLPNNQVSVIYKVDEGKKVLVKKITIIGNEAISDDELKKAMEIKEASAFSFITSSGIYKMDVFMDDIERIRSYYMNRGYIQIKVLDPKVYLTPDKQWLYLTISLEEGEQFYVGKVGFEGDLIFETDELFKTITIKEGKVFNRELLGFDIFNLTEKYGDKGYAFANVEPLTRIDVEKRIVHINFSIEKGDKVYFRRVVVVGNTRTRDKVIRRQLKVVEGKLYSGSAIRKSRERVYRLGFFEEVDIATRRVAQENKLDVEVNIKERPTGSLQAGAGWSSYSGLMGMFQVSEGNLFGLGKRMSFSAQISKKQKDFSIDYHDPYFLDTKWSLGGGIYHRTMEYYGYTQSRWGGSTQFGYHLTDFTRSFVTYKYENNKISGVKDKRFYPDGVTSSVKWSLSRDTKNHPFDPSKGSVNSCSVEFAGKPLPVSGDFDFVKYHTSSSWFFGLPLKTVISFNGRASLIQARGGSKIPFGERFRLGGIHSVRGYDFQSLSPTKTVLDASDPSAVPYSIRIGGNKEVIFTSELLFPIIQPAGLKGVVFYDTGAAFLEGEYIDFSEFRQGWGFGIRWFSPIGPLRFEWGFPINRRPGEKSQVFEFFIGSFF